MRKFKYIGPHDEVEINGVGIVKKGQTIEVRDPATADSLQEQAETFEHVIDRKRSEAAKKAAETRAAESSEES